MPQLTLNCPTCRKRLIHVPLDGLTLHYYCEDHGLLILKPLVIVGGDRTGDATRHGGSGYLSTHDAA